MTRPVCIYDANVLYPAQLRDVLMRLAVAGLVRAHWTDEIHDEWMRNVRADHPDIMRDQLERTRRLMERALPDARVTDYATWIPRIDLPDPDDRHVVAAAVKIGADVIVTFNLDDFPDDALAPFGVEAIHPDSLFLSRIEDSPSAVIDVARKHRASLQKPPKSPSEYVHLLRMSGLRRTANWLAERKEHL